MLRPIGGSTNAPQLSVKQLQLATYQHKSGFATSKAYIPLAPSLTVKLSPHTQQSYFFRVFYRPANTVLCCSHLVFPHTRSTKQCPVCRDRSELFSRRPKSQTSNYLYKQRTTDYSRNGLQISENLLPRSVSAVLLL